MLGAQAVEAKPNTGLESVLGAQMPVKQALDCNPRDLCSSPRTSPALLCDLGQIASLICASVSPCPSSVFIYLACELREAGSVFPSVFMQNRWTWVLISADISRFYHNTDGNLNPKREVPATVCTCLSF